MRPGTPQFVKERLIEVREARGLSAASLAELIGVSRSAISAYENGHVTPHPDSLRRIAEILDVPSHRFLRPVEDESQYVVWWRSLSAATKTERSQAARKHTWLRDLVRVLSHHVNLPASNFPAFDVPSAPELVRDEDIECLAERTRRFWNLGDRPISNVVWLLENNGTIVVRQDFESDTLDAFSAWVPSEGRPYCTLSSDKDSCSRSRFDIAHELAHLIVHRNHGARYIRRTDSHRLMERQAMLFAGAFLLPASSFSSDLTHTSLDAFASLKEKWQVSIGAMISRAATLRIITPDQERRLWMSYNRRGWRRREPFDDVLPPEEPRLIVRSMGLLLDRGVLASREVEALLGLRPHDLERLVGAEPGSIFSSESADPPVTLKFPNQLTTPPGRQPPSSDRIGIFRFAGA